MITTKIAMTRNAAVCAACLAQRRAAAVKQVEREGGGQEDRSDDAEAHGVAVVGVVAGEVGEQHRPRGECPDPADHRRRPFDQVARTDPPGQDERQPAAQEPFVYLLHVRHG
jgi:hypothetical protein